MNILTRGFRNAFRNGIRSASVIIILGLSIGLSLTMLVANKAVSNKIAAVKGSIGNTITIAPAGFTPGAAANNALTTSQLSKVKSVAHVTGLNETLSDRLPTTGSALPSFGFRGNGNSSGSTTSLNSPVQLNANSGIGRRIFIDGGGSLPTNFSLPVSFVGTTDPAQLNGSSITIKSGKMIDPTSTANDALVSSAMASKNNLNVGSTFTAYNQTLTVAGIFNGGTQAQDGTVVLSLPLLQSLSGQSDTVTSAVATVDSLDNLSPATAAIKNLLGANADVTSAQDQANATVQPLDSVKTVSLYSLIGAVVAGAVIILLIMVMVVRERKREIGVVKAIGGSNLHIMSEFVVEALTLTIASALIGLAIGIVAGQPVTKLLVSNSTSSAAGTFQRGGGRFAAFGGGGPGGGFARRFSNNGAVRGLRNIDAQIGWGILLDGFGAAVLIAVVGSALASGMIARVRPSEVLRSE